jgi:hypothetical protein
VVVFESTATEIPCDNIFEENGVDTMCLNVLITITADVSTGFDPVTAAALTEASIQTGEFATVLEDVSEIVATVILPPSFPSSSPSTSIVDPSSVPTLKPSNKKKKETKEEKRKQKHQKTKQEENQEFIA